MRVAIVAGILAAATVACGCGGAREVEVRGSTRSFANLGGPLWVLVVDADAFDDGEQSPVIARLAQEHEPGDFAIAVETDAETLEVFAIRDNDESRTCSQGDETADARVVIGDAEHVDVPELDVSASPAGPIVDCPSYAALF